MTQSNSIQQQRRFLLADIIASCQQLIVLLQQQTFELQKLTARLSEIELHQQDEMASIEEFDPPIVEPKSVSTRLKINRLVRDYAKANNIAYRDAWLLLYMEFRDCYHIDLRVRAKNNGKLKPLDICEQLEMMEELYAVASKKFASRLAYAS